jgi:hypothetical protein
MRANVYIDGFNLYYGALRGTPYKWLDLEALSRKIIPGYEINRIRYFTANITPQPDDPDARRRQYLYLRAVANNPLISIHLGYFQRSRVRMALAYPQPGQARTVEVLKTEEKGTDVNIATYLLLDTFRNDSDLSLVISNDADLAEPIRVLMSEFGASVGIASPFRQPCRRLADLQPIFIRRIRTKALMLSQLPSVLADKHGLVSRASNW